MSKGRNFRASKIEEKIEVVEEKPVIDFSFITLNGIDYECINFDNQLTYAHKAWFLERVPDMEGTETGFNWKNPKDIFFFMPVIFAAFYKQRTEIAFNKLNANKRVELFENNSDINKEIIDKLTQALQSFFSSRAAVSLNIFQT